MSYKNTNFTFYTAQSLWLAYMALHKTVLENHGMTQTGLHENLLKVHTNIIDGLNKAYRVTRQMVWPKERGGIIRDKTGYTGMYRAV